MSDYTVTFTDHEITSCDFAGCIKALESAHNWGTANLLRKIAKECAPRIPEPGLWGVVEAHTEGNRNRLRYGRTSDRRWMREESSAGYEWSELIDPTLVREGVKS